MKADWVEIRHDDVLPRYAGIYVSMNRKGHIVLSRNTYNMMQAPPAFIIYFDKTNKRIGLKASAASGRNAYRALVSNRHGAKMVRGFRLMREHRIIITQTLYFPDADIDEDGILVLDLRTAIPSKRAEGQSLRRLNEAGK